MPGIRNPNCTKCSMHREADGEDRCVVGLGQHNAKIMVVTKFPSRFREIRVLLDSVGLKGYPIYVTSAIKCRTWNAQPTNAEVKICREYLDKEIEKLQPEWILTFGNEALFAATGHSGIMKHRGKLFPHKISGQCFGTLNPKMVELQPGYHKGFHGDLRLFTSFVTGQAVREYPKVPFCRAMNTDQLEELIWNMKFAHGVSVDIESNMFDEWKPDSRMVSISFTLWDKDDVDPRIVWAVPLYHPESPFRHNWIEILQPLLEVMMQIPVRVMHNAKFDCRWMTEFYGKLVTATFCTMIAAHLLDENRSKALANIVREDLGIPDWKIPTKKLLEDPILKVLKYNGEDTLNTARLYFALRDQLKQEPAVARIFMKLMMPASNMFVEVEPRGVWIDRPLLHERWDIIKKKLIEIDAELMKYVPTNHHFKKVNFNPSNFLRWWLFEYLELPILKAGKAGPSFAEDIKWKLKDEHPVVPLLIQRAEVVKFHTSFFGAYDELMDDNDRIHTTFKLAKTVTGRLASGKGDEDKVQARVERGINLQQVPRDPFVRGVVGAPPMWRFITGDYSQVEFRIGSMLANEEAALALYASGGDVHLNMAVSLTGKPPDQILKEERKRAKWINFGFLFGMGWQTFIDTVWRGYQTVVTPEEAKEYRRTFFKTYPGFMRWHRECREFARKHGYVKSLLGRVRHLPNVYSSSKKIAAEAERQAINSPVQSLASDLNLFSAILVNWKAKEMGLRLNVLGTVHDETLYECHQDDVDAALPLIHDTMENLPLKRTFGIELTVPLVANLSCKRHWKEGAEDKDLTLEEIYNWRNKDAA